MLGESCFERLEDRRMLSVDFAQVGVSLNTQLLGMQTQLTSTLNDYQSGAHSSLPMVGKTLGSSAQIVNRFNTELQGALTSLGTVTHPTNLQIQNALAVVPFLVDRSGNGVGPDDVLITRPGTLGSEGFAVQMRLQAGQAASPSAVSFNSGLPSLPLSVTTASSMIEVSVGFAFELAFTYNANNQQVALDSSKTLNAPLLPAPDASHPIVDPLHPLAIFVSAEFPDGFNAISTMGFVQGRMTPLPDQANAFHLTVMANNLTGTPSLKLDGAANLNFRHTGGFTGSDADFPGIDVDIHVNWAFASSDPAANRPVITFDNAYLDLGKFISQVVGPVFEAIQTTTAPMQPVEDILRYELPGLSDLSELVGGDPITLLDIADIVVPYTGFPGPLWDLIRSVGDLIHAINQIEIDPTVRLPLGGFDLNNHDLRDIVAAGDVSNLSLANLTDFSINNIQGLGTDFSQVVDELALTADEKDLVKKLVKGLNNGYEIKFPILDSPRDSVFGLLLGKDADLFTLTADYAISSQASELPSFSVFGMGVEFTGDVDVDLHFKFAYDTYGLRKLVNHLAAGDTSQTASDIIDGFYIADDSYFNLAGALKAGVGARFGIFSATVGGFVSTDDSGIEPVSITIDDPNNDGKLRFAEFQQDGFDTSGRFVAALGIEVKVGVTVLGKFIGFKKRFDIASTIIVDLNTPDPNAPVIPTGPILASQPDENGTIELYVGASAHLRQQVSQTNGDDRIIIRNIETTAQGETIEIALLQEWVVAGLPVTEFWVTQTISGVQAIAGYGDLGDLIIDVLPGVNVDVHFEGGQGRAEFLYNGAGSAYLKAGEDDSYLLGGQGGNILFGGPGNDTLVLGPGGNLASGGLGDNNFVIVTPLLNSGAILGGSDEGNNTFVVIAGENTQSISAMPAADGSINLNYQIADAPPAPGLGLRQFSTLVISAQDRATDITIGDLSPAGVSQVFVNNPTEGVGGRNVVLDTKSDGGVSHITVDHFLHSYINDEDPENLLLVENNELQVVNATTGVTTYLMGMKAEDLTTIQQHGGSAHIGQLSKDEGALAFDFSSRQPGTVQTVTMTTPALDTGNWITSHALASGEFVLNAINNPTLVFDGLRVVDSITIHVAEPTQATGLNQLLLDASSLVGTLNVNSLGGPSASHLVTISKLSEHGNIAVDGGGTFTAAIFGTGQLGHIRGDVSIQNTVLTIDNSSAQSFSFLTMTETLLSGWTIPGFIGNPALTYSSLHGVMTVHAGADDRFILEGAPASITSAAFNNATTSRDQIYIAAWTKPLTFNGDFSLYLGGRLTVGNLDRIKRLTSLANLSITMNFSSVLEGGSNVIFDGDLDPEGASYTIAGIGNLMASNQTLGLSVTINGYRDQDQLHVHLPGGSVTAELTRTGRGTIYVSGTGRSSASASAANSIIATLQPGTHTLDPTGLSNSVLRAFNHLYLLGSQTHDDLTLNLPTVTASNNSLIANGSNLVGTLHINALNPLMDVLAPFGWTSVTLAAVNPLLAVFVVGSDPFEGGANYLLDQTVLHFGTGQLSRIRGNVNASKVVLNIDSSTTVQPSDLMLTDTKFYNWIVPPGLSSPPVLQYSSLYHTLSVQAGAGDRFGLQQSPVGVSDLVMHNAHATLDPVYTSAWSVPITLHGNFSFYAGRRLVPGDLSQEQNATIERERRLTDVPVPVTLNFSGQAASEVVFDGDLDPAGASYIIGGTNNLRVVNQTVGLDVTLNGYRSQDQVHLRLPGASVSADLRKTGAGRILLDGRERLDGTNPTEPNELSVQVRAGDISLAPVDTYDSVLQVFNTLFVLGSMPQDSLGVTAPTDVKLVPTQLGSRQGVESPWSVVTANGFDTGYIVDPPAAHFAVLSASFPLNRIDPLILTTNYPGVEFADSHITTLGVRSVNDASWSGNVTVRVFPLSTTPQPTNNSVSSDASQLRGTLDFQVSQPDYATSIALSQGLRLWGSAPVASFAHTEVTVSKVHPQLSTTVTGTTPTSNDEWFGLNSAGGTVQNYPGTQVQFGTETLADIQGDVAVSKVWLQEVDNRHGDASVLVLTGNTLSNWNTVEGTTQPMLTFDSLQGELTLTGSPLDRFAIEGTPNTAWKTTIRNFSESESPVGVYVMGKTVMPVEVTGNFDLFVGQRLNPDGSVTALGQVRNVFNKQEKFFVTNVTNVNTGFQTRFHNQQLVAPSFEFLPSAHIRYTDGYAESGSTANQRPLPVFYNYVGAGQGKLVFDASGEQVTGVSSDLFFNSQQYYQGVSTNSFYPDRADLRFYQHSIIYGQNADVFFHSPQLVESAGFGLRNPGPSTLIDNPFSTAVHYIAANASLAGPNLVEHVLIGNVLGPVHIQGNGRGTRVEINPLFSLPIGTHTTAAFEPIYNFPGWGRGHTGAFTLLETVQAAVTVDNAALRVIADIPLPSGWAGGGERPDVRLTGSQLIGIANGTIHFSNLSNSVSAKNAFGFLDITSSGMQLPGLSIQLPADDDVAITISDTPAGATTVISTRLSASDSQMTTGPIQVLGTTGPLVLGRLFYPFTAGTGVSFLNYQVTAGQPIGSLQWDDGLSAPLISIGDQGSLQSIFGPILISGDSRNNSPIVTLIDGSADPSRSNVTFTQPTYSQPPQSIVSSAANSGLANFYAQVDGLAPAPIYFGDFFRRPRALEIHGSGGSSYNITENSKPGVPPTTKLYTGPNGSVVYNSGTAGPMSIIGATSVHMILGSGLTSGNIPGYSGVPQIFVQQAPAQPQPIDLRLDRRTVATQTPNTPLLLTNAGAGQMSLSLNQLYWDVIYPGTPTHLAINYGPISVSDTGAGGTVISGGSQTVDVFGTTGPLRINASGTASVNVVRLGQSNSMQAIQGEVEIYSNATAPQGLTTLTLNNSADASQRATHLATDGEGALRITGLAPAMIKLFGERFTTTISGGIGGSTFSVENTLFPQTAQLITILAGGTSDHVVGPDVPTTWTIDGANSVRLGANVRINNVRNLRGGAANDLFRFATSTATHIINGELDGGAGFNTLEYVVVPNPFVTDLVVGTAPRIGGSVKRIHAVIPERLSFTVPNLLENIDGASVQLQLIANSVIGGSLTFGASELPTGLQLDSATGLISGTIADGGFVGSTTTYQVVVTVNNGLDSRFRNLEWRVFGTTPIPQEAQVVGRYIFYNGSYFDGNNSAAGAADDVAIATDKQALLPGATATFANYTSYSKGINGLMIDIADLKDNPTLADFNFRIGNDNYPANWPIAAAPQSISVRRGAGQGGSDRVTIVWASGVIRNSWLQVTLIADANTTGLTQPDQFYVGNAVGETGNSPLNAFVDGTDFARVRDNPRNFINRAPVDFNYDINRDSFVDGTDVALVRDNSTNFITALKLIAPVGSNNAGSGSRKRVGAYVFDSKIGQPSTLHHASSLVSSNKRDTTDGSDGDHRALPAPLTLAKSVDSIMANWARSQPWESSAFDPPPINASVSRVRGGHHRLRDFEQSISPSAWMDQIDDAFESPF